MSGSGDATVGPVCEIPIGNFQAPFYVVPFDEDGVCTGPRTTAHLRDRLGRGGFTHAVVLSHGWNNDWSDAMRLYNGLVDGLLESRARHAPALEFRPVVIGLFWPGIALVAPWERGPRIAGAPAPAAVDDGEWQRNLQAVARSVDAAERGRFYELAQRPAVDGDEAAELARLLVPAWSGRGEPLDDLPTYPDLDAEELLAIWRLAAAREQGRPQQGASEAPPPGPFAGAAGPNPVRAPEAAGLLDLLDPRNVVRMTTVWQMKDRAGRVGARGVAALLDGVLGATDAPVHLVGHSYGGKVLLSAVCFLPGTARPVESVLLLQPAMSHLCFAENVLGLNRPGGYRPALTRVRQPILATFSRHDVPLTRLFHLAVRRASDLGEIAIAGAPPSRYAALGGYGPPVNRPESDVVEATAPGAAYAHEAGLQLIGVESSDVIGGHGEVSNAVTWWMLLDQIRRAPR